MADCCMLYTVCKVEQFVLTIIKERLLLLLTSPVVQATNIPLPKLAKLVTLLVCHHPTDGRSLEG